MEDDARRPRPAAPRRARLLLASPRLASSSVLRRARFLFLTRSRRLVAAGVGRAARPAVHRGRASVPRCSPRAERRDREGVAARRRRPRRDAMARRRRARRARPRRLVRGDREERVREVRRRGVPQRLRASGVEGRRVRGVRDDATETDAREALSRRRRRARADVARRGRDGVRVGRGAQGQGGREGGEPQAVDDGGAEREEDDRGGVGATAEGGGRVEGRSGARDLGADERADAGEEEDRRARGGDARGVRPQESIRGVSERSIAAGYRHRCSNKLRLRL
ncbi:uncharacterized protein MICPUCDRAFT_67136 [Micromonas pusilla CCMP1545]|uniref:Predicted protein n=1 Tax=Micromonas pusilla (strain CCMP1545) TaxID=564608 RepID=C1MPS2_MICPC|nr:uncharacterized protein MICPUCDRAFT_67136 [Micromonas pusilla CCMP1545]EEH57951.1 predicted protein [Micromonas pusilla CCMP1545]|eukprot:XP_003058000.1 predicted protein [Micromonas pusilla CCMP1545]